MTRWPSLRQVGSREDELREAIHPSADRSWIASSASLLAMTARNILRELLRRDSRHVVASAGRLASSACSVLMVE